MWKAYGYWARPTVNRVLVHNASMLLPSPGRLGLKPDNAHLFFDVIYSTWAGNTF